MLGTHLEEPPVLQLCVRSARSSAKVSSRGNLIKPPGLLGREDKGVGEGKHTLFGARVAAA